MWQAWPGLLRDSRVLESGVGVGFGWMLSFTSCTTVRPRLAILCPRSPRSHLCVPHTSLQSVPGTSLPDEVVTRITETTTCNPRAPYCAKPPTDDGDKPTDGTQGKGPGQGEGGGQGRGQGRP